MKGGLIMEPLINAKDLELFWAQPGAMKRSFILRSGERIFGSLTFRSAFGSLADAISGKDSWTFKRVGFFSPRVTIRRAGSGIDIAIYQPRWTGTEGSLLLSGGRSYLWRVANFWATRYTFSDSQGNELVTYRSGSDEQKLSNLIKQQAQVEIALQAWQLPEVDLLVILGWYLVILQQEDASAVAVTASIAVLN